MSHVTTYGPAENPQLLDIAQKLGQCLSEIKQVQSAVATVGNQVEELAERVDQIEDTLQIQKAETAAEQRTVEKMERQKQGGSHKSADAQDAKSGQMTVTLPTRDVLYIIAIIAAALTGNWKAIVEVFK